MSTTDIIIRFITEIGLKVHFEIIEEPTFLPGIFIRDGSLVIDASKLLYPGDILHEAGHLAVMPLRIREKMTGDLNMDPIHHGGELAAMAWSYAACLHLGIDPHIVFHEDGYKGGGGHLVANFEDGSEMGVPLLVWQDMAVGKNNEGEQYPKMKNWLCQVDRYIDAGKV